MALSKVILELTGDAKVGDLDDTRRAQEQVGWFDISVNYMHLTMKVLQAIKHLPSDVR
jgi:hypothetical protein